MYDIYVKEVLQKADSGVNFRIYIPKREAIYKTENKQRGLLLNMNMNQNVKCSFQKI
jgi:hypothetical protein